MLYGAFGMLLAVAAAEAPITLTLDEAVQIAVQQNFQLQQARLSQQDAKAQEKGAWSRVMPRLDATVQYTRNIAALDHFAGTGAGAGFGAFGSVGWLQFNEAARTDGDPATNPIPLAEFQQRTNQGLIDAGLDPNASPNLFLVENQLRMALALTQVIYDHALLASLDGVELLTKLADAGVDAQVLRVTADTSSAFYSALLAEAQAKVLEQSVERASANVTDTKVRVDAGALPEFQLVSAEVELANLQTSLVQAKAGAMTARDQLSIIKISSGRKRQASVKFL